MAQLQILVCNFQLPCVRWCVCVRSMLHPINGAPLWAATGGGESRAVLEVEEGQAVLGQVAQDELGVALGGVQHKGVDVVGVAVELLIPVSNLF